MHLGAQPYAHTRLGGLLLLYQRRVRCMSALTRFFINLHVAVGMRHEAVAVLLAWLQVTSVTVVTCYLPV